jgi:PhnB protein
MAKKKAGKKRPAAKKAVKKTAKRSTPKKAAAPKRKKDGRPPQWWPALSPYMTVRDGQSSIEFYARAFGFETDGQVMRGDDGQVQHAGMRLGEAAIMFGPEEGSMGLRAPAAGAPNSLSLYVYVPDVDALAARATVVQGLTDQEWGDRTAVFTDPDGYHWTFATHLGG